MTRNEEKKNYTIVRGSFTLRSALIYCTMKLVFFVAATAIARALTTAHASAAAAIMRERASAAAGIAAAAAETAQAFENGDIVHASDMAQSVEAKRRRHTLSSVSAKDLVASHAAAAGGLENSGESFANAAADSANPAEIGVEGEEPWSSGVNDDETCSVCLEKITLAAKEDIALTPCKHFFHSDCIAKWVAASASETCPMCRGEIAEPYTVHLRHGQHPIWTLRTARGIRHVHETPTGLLVVSSDGDIANELTTELADLPSPGTRSTASAIVSTYGTRAGYDSRWEEQREAANTFNAAADESAARDVHVGLPASIPLGAGRLENTRWADSWRTYRGWDGGEERRWPDAPSERDTRRNSANADTPQRPQEPLSPGQHSDSRPESYAEQSPPARPQSTLMQRLRASLADIACCSGADGSVAGTILGEDTD